MAVDGIDHVAGTVVYNIFPSCVLIEAAGPSQMRDPADDASIPGYVPAPEPPRAGSPAQTWSNIARENN